jgi:HEAT repeat protein
MIPYLLQALWAASLLFAGVSSVVLTLIIVRRGALSFRSVSATEARDAVLQSLMTDWALLEEVAVKRLLRRPRQLADMIVELATLVRGPAFSKIILHLAEKGAAPQLLRLLRRGNREDRLVACEALAHFPSADVMLQLGKLAASAKSSRVRIAALRASIQMGNRPRFDDVIGWMGLKRPDIPAEAFSVLKMAAIQQPEIALERISRSNDTPGIRAALIWSIGETGSYAAIPVLEALLGNNDARIRAAALHAIAEIGVCADPSKLQYCLTDGVPDVRAEAATAIGKTGGAAAAKWLSALLDDGNWDVRFRAACALAALGDPGISELRAAAETAASTPRRARAAAMILSEKCIS